MSSIPERSFRDNIALFLVGCLVLWTGGCQTAHKPEPTQTLVAATEPNGLDTRATKVAENKKKYDPVQPNPRPDPAAAVRNWQPVSCRYAAGGAIAFPDYWIDPKTLPRPIRENTAEAFFDPEIFMAQAAVTPVWMVFAPPWKEVIYRAVTYPPTMTGAPPLPSK